MIPEAKRFNTRYLRHMAKSALGRKSQPPPRAPRWYTAQEAHAFFRGPIEELAAGPSVAQASTRFSDALTPIVRDGLGRSCERVVFIANAWQRVGGVISVAHLVDDLIELGLDAKVVAFDPHCFAAELPSKTEPIFFANRREFVEDFPEADVVVATYWATMYALMHLFVHRPDFAPAYFVQDFEPYFYPEHDMITRAQVEQTYRMTPFCFAKTRWVCGNVETCGGTAQLVPPAVDLTHFAPAESSDPVQENTVLAMVRPSTARRNPKDTLRVLAQVAKAVPSTRIELFGCDDDTVRNLEPEFAYTNHGVLDQHAIADRYRAASIFLDCSDFHGFGRTAAEALACGTPCVVTRSGGVEDFCRHGENSLMAEPGDIDGIAQAVIRLLTDPALHDRLAAEARASVLSFDRMNSARATLQYFQRIVAGA